MMEQKFGGTVFSTISPYRVSSFNLSMHRQPNGTTRDEHRPYFLPKPIFINLPTALST